MINPKISVIVPVYNTEKYLGKCVGSIINQTYENLEIILVDDGSTDGSGEIVDKFAEKDSRVVAIHQLNSGVSSARNVGMQASTGDYIGFVDSDDWLEKHMYQRMVQVLSDDELDMVVCGYFKDTDRCSEEMKNLGTVSDEVFGREQMLRYVFYRDRYKGVAAYPWNKIFRKEVMDRNDVFFDTSLKIGEDVLWFTEVALKTQKIRYVDESLYHYWQRNNSAFHSINLCEKMDSIRAYQRVIELLDENIISEDVIVYVKRFLAYHAMNIAKMAGIQKKGKEYRRMCSWMRKYENEYRLTNAEYPERIKEFDEILKLENGI